MKERKGLHTGPDVVAIALDGLRPLLGVLVLAFCLPALAGDKVAQASESTAPEVASFTVTLAPDGVSEETTTPQDDYELYSEGYSCGAGDQATCQTRCVDFGNEHYGAGWILMAVGCSMDTDGMAHCSCEFTGAGPYHPPCYWSCGGYGRGRIGY